MNFNEIFEYCKITGELFRKRSNNQHKHVGWVNSSGYKQVEIKSKAYMLHHIIWAMHNGELPPKGLQIDHIDRNPLNNRIENLRLATQNENQINSKLPTNNTTGFKGVLKTPSGKFQARLGYNGKKLYLGLFPTAEEAAKCVEENTRRLYGEFTPS